MCVRLPCMIRAIEPPPHTPGLGNRFELLMVSIRFITASVGFGFISFNGQQTWIRFRQEKNYIICGI